ncbi:MAG: aspartate-semialdehyde dehydrogenase [Myxococcales bacterium]|nr:aspartate-semialdehyde dehydrogenase [Myxococcales bacterium]
MAQKYTVAVVGATGLVGQTMLRVLEERQFPVERLVPFASERSAGKSVAFNDGGIATEPLDPARFEGVHFALFSAGGDVSRKWAPVAAAMGAVVIDNSSAWRMDPDVPLCVPEVNLKTALDPKKGIIANPNCSTIQLVVALKPIYDAVGIDRIVVSTYQAASGAGAKAVQALRTQIAQEAAGQPIEPGALGGILAGNLLMHWKAEPNGYHEEELKLIRETRKILGDDTIQISPTAVRVPVETGHSEAVTLTTRRPISVAQVRALLAQAPGVELVDDFAQGLYPTPLAVCGKDAVLVGRIREDLGQPGGLQMWIVGDNLRKGAALNAVQIAEGLIRSR